MNANQVLNMVIRMVMNRVIRTGVNAGINAVGNKMAKKEDGQPNQGNAPQSAETEQRMKQTLRMTRKIGRF